MPVDTLSRFIILKLTEPNIPAREGYIYGYTLFETLPDIHIDNSKHTPMPLVSITSISTINNSNVDMKVKIILKITCC